MKANRINSGYDKIHAYTELDINTFRVAEIIKYPEIAPDTYPDSRRGKGRIAVLCSPCRNTEAGQVDKQDWDTLLFPRPLSQVGHKNRARPTLLHGWITDCRW